jgi:hypothetical protein
VSANLVLDHFLGLAVPAEDRAEHLATETIIGEVGVVQNCRVRVRDIAKPGLCKFEEVDDLAIFRALEDLLA